MRKLPGVLYYFLSNEFFCENCIFRHVFLPKKISRKHGSIPFEINCLKNELGTIPYIFFPFLNSAINFLQNIFLRTNPDHLFLVK